MRVPLEAREELQTWVLQGAVAFQGDVHDVPPKGAQRAKPRKSGAAFKGLRGGGGCYSRARDHVGRAAGCNNQARHLIEVKSRVEVCSPFSRERHVSQGGEAQWRHSLHRLRGGTVAELGEEGAAAGLESAPVDVDVERQRRKDAMRRDQISKRKMEEGVVSKRQERQLELLSENLEKLSFRALTDLLSKEFGVKPGVTPYNEELWPDIVQMEGSQEYINMLLWEAALRGNHSAVAPLVQRGAQLQARDNSRGGWTALHFAATGADQLFVGCEDLVQARTVRKLVELGADVNCSTLTGWTPLHAASTRGHTCTVIRLGALGAHLEARDSKGRTSLHMASRWGWCETVEALLSLGANVSACDTEGLTSRDHAWYFKEKVGGGDFDATITVLVEAAASTGVSEALRTPDAADVAAVGGEMQAITEAGSVDSRIEEGPVRRDIDEGNYEAGMEKEPGDSEDKNHLLSNSNSVLRDLNRAVGGKSAGEELSPYDIPRTTQTIPWWDTSAWQDRAQRFQTASAKASAGLPRSHSNMMHNASKGQFRDAIRPSAGVSASMGSKDQAPLEGEAEVFGPDTEKDEFGNVLLSKCRVSFPRKSRKHGGDEDQREVDGSGDRTVVAGQQKEPRDANPRHSLAGSTQGMDFLETLAGVERIDLVAKRRLRKFQERMTPRGFKDGTILRDHIDFGGGRGADREGHRN